MLHLREFFRESVGFILLHFLSLFLSLSLGAPHIKTNIFGKTIKKQVGLLDVTLFASSFQITQFFLFFIFERKCIGPLVLVLFSVLIYSFYLFSLVFLILFSCILLIFYFFLFFISIKSQVYFPT